MKSFRARRCRDKHVFQGSPRWFSPYLLVGKIAQGLLAALVLASQAHGPLWSAKTHRWEPPLSTGELDLTSNVQFGEGGAGAFSDGKLNTGTKDLRHRFILEELVRCGAPKETSKTQNPMWVPTISTSP